MPEDKPQTADFAGITARSLYGVKQFVPPTYTEYKIKRDGWFGPKRLVKVAEGVMMPLCYPDIDLAVCDNGFMVGISEAMDMYCEIDAENAVK